MRRKSSRTAAKATPEKPVESPRKSRRQSKRHKKSSSPSSSEEPVEDVVVECDQKQSEIQAGKSVESKPEEQTTWKIAPSSTPTGEVQTLKLCLTRPSSLSPEKIEKCTRRRRSKSGGQTEEDVVSNEIMLRKLRHRGSSGEKFEDQDEDSDHQEDKKGKGKSKAKHKSKSEKDQQIQDLTDISQSEISENVQVTPQSPQAPIDIAVDNENVSTNENESVIPAETTGQPVETTNCDKAIENVETNVSDENNRDSDTPPPTLEQQESDRNHLNEQFKGFDTAPELVRVDSEVVKEVVSPQVREEVVIECKNADDDTVPKVGTEVVKSPSVEINQEESRDDEPEISLPTSDGQNKPESNSSDGGEHVIPSDESASHSTPVSTEQVVAMIPIEESPPDTAPVSTEQVTPIEASAPDDTHNVSMDTAEETNRSDDDSASADVTMDTTSVKDSTSLDITQSFSPDIRQIVEVNEELQNLKNDTLQILEKVAKPRVARTWGSPYISLELMKNSLQKIDVNTIKLFCPNVKLLQEDEVKMDIRERKSSHMQEGRERRINRKVSIDFKPEDGESKRLSTQSSVNSEIEEAVEPEVDNSNIIAMNRKISIVDDTASKLKPPPSPAKNPISELLYITNLVRPFTLKQLKELLERTGKIRENGFWTDRIKSKCYAYYETAEEAEATRNALHGVHWPIGNGKKLIIEYSTEEDLEKARNPTPPPPPPVVPPPLMANVATLDKQVPVDEPPKNSKPEESERPVKEHQHSRGDGHVREWDIGKENMHKPRYRSRERDERDRERGRERERLERHKRRRTPSPTDNYLNRKEKKKEEDVPQKLMDDLFRKTKTTPSIYWLPLTPDEIATKQQQRLLRMAEHKRRMEESSRGSRGDYGRGAPYRRRYD
uniref:RRM domain-containing protein n=1 Tax=Photinus pyralis TaxID=7054 RepID=A0A1Y1KVX1_PHOPY